MTHHVQCRHHLHVVDHSIGRACLVVHCRIWLKVGNLTGGYYCWHMMIVGDDMQVGVEIGDTGSVVVIGFDGPYSR